MRKVDAETVFTPILGAVPCGTPQIEENIEEYLPSACCSSLPENQDSV